MMMLVIPSIANPFWPSIAQSLQNTLVDAGYSLVFANTDGKSDQERALLAMARRNRFDAIALNPVDVSVSDLKALGVPVVVLGLRQAYAELDQVGSDSYEGTRTAIDHLLHKGHRRIGFIWGEPSASESRYRGYRDALNAEQIPFDLDLVARADYTMEGGRIATRTLMQRKERPTAIFASNDVMALAAIQEITALGLKVPDDVSLMGMDDIEPAAMSTPALTTIGKDKHALGKKAAELLLARINQQAPKGPQHIAVPCTLVERQTVGSPPAR
jgi:LacI family transcriptional regulator